MFAIKRELKLNHQERCLMGGMAGFSRFVYNLADSMVMASWQFEGIEAI